MSLLLPAEAAARIGESKSVLLDVRTPAEFSAARIAGALNADWYRPDFRRLIDDLDRDETTLVYCRTGVRSAEAARLMGALGFTNVCDLAGGIVAWYQAGLPIEQ